MTREKALEHKALGNKEFTAQNFEAAVKHFTDAIAEDDTDHVFFSNRSACYSSLGEYEKALADGKKCVELKPDWAKGYSRKGLAEYHLGQLEAAETTYEAGLKLAPTDGPLKEGLDKVKSAKARPSGGGMGNFSIPPALLMAMQRNPKIGEYLQDPALMTKFQMFMQAQEDPKLMKTLAPQLMGDQRLMELIMAAQGMDIADMGGPREAEASEPTPAQKKPKQEEPPPPPVDERTDEQKAADAFKEEGNALYKARKFEEAVAAYDKAIEACPNDLTYYNNKAAVYLEMKRFDECETMLKDVLERKFELNSALPGGASFEKVGKVLNRLASCYAKQLKYDDAIEMYKKSLAEDNNRNTRNALRDLERAKEKAEKEAYINPELAEEHRTKGNGFFGEGKYVEAKAEYDEAIKRNPTDPKLWSNRAGALQKLMAHPDALKDLDEALRLDPKFVKAYSRKGACHFFLKDYNKALKAYDEGLAINPDDDGCKQGKAQVISKIQSQAMGGASGDKPDQEQVREAMKDPEIQSILRDPQMNLILQQMQDDPRSAQEMINKDPKIANAVSKLMAAGILRMG